MTLRRLAAILAVTAAGAGPLWACSLAVDDSFEFIPADEIPAGLDQTTTTTTTTTTIPTAPTPVEPTVPATTVPAPVQTAPVEIYFVLGLQQLQRQTLQLSFPVEPLQVLAQLADGPPADQSSIGLRTAVRPNLTNAFDNPDGTATIDLRGSVLNRTPPREQDLAIAQLVLTVTRLPGVGQVRFTLDGEPIAIPVPPSLNMSEPGQPLSYSMFSGLLTSTAAATTSEPPTPPVPPTTSDPTTTTSTTLPTGPGRPEGIDDPDDPDDPGTRDDGDSGDDRGGEVGDASGDPGDGDGDGAGTGTGTGASPPDDQ
jgi:hypothetical protein